MRVLTHHRVARRIALVLAVAPVLIACGVILDVADDPVSPPDRVDGGQGESAIGQESGPLDPDATAGDSGGDACATAAACSPQRLTTLSGGVIRLVVVGNSLYAAHTSSAGERVVSLASGAPGPVLDLDPQAQVPNLFGASSNIAVDMNGAVYWGTANGLRRHDVGAGADASTDAGVTPFSDLGSPVSGVRIADGRLHFTVNTPTGGLNGGYIGSCALPGCTGVQSAVTVAYPLDVIASGNSRWWLGATSGADFTVVFRTTGQILSGAQLTPSRMVTDGTHIFWSTNDNLRMFTMGGAAPVDLIAAATDGTTRVNGVAVDPAGTLFVTQQSNVLRCKLVGGQCAFTTVATTPDLATDIAADATHLYWGTDKGAVWRMRKP